MAKKMTKENDSPAETFHCEECKTRCVATGDGYITGCEHHPLKMENNPHRRASFLELVIKHQETKNPVTASVYKDIIIKRVASASYD